MAFTIDQLGKIESAARHLADLTPEELNEVAERLAQDDVDNAASIADVLQSAVDAETDAQIAADADDDGPVRRINTGRTCAHHDENARDLA